MWARQVRRAQREAAQGVRITVVGPIPPPMHGAARVTQAMIELFRLRPQVEVRVVDMSSDGRALPRLRRGSRLATVLARSVVPARLARVTYIGGAGGLLLWFQAGLVAASTVGRQQVVFHHHSFAYLNGRSAAMALLCRIGGSRAIHVVLDEGMGELLRSRYRGVAVVRVVSNAAIFDREPQSLPQPGPLVLGHVSNLSLDKGLGEVLSAFRAACEAGFDVRCVIGGPVSSGPVAELLAEAQANASDRLEVRGRLDDEGLRRFYADIDLFLFPSRYVHEAEPLVVLDAMRHGVSTCAFAVGCLPSLVEEGLLVGVDEDFSERLLAVLGRGSVPGVEATLARFVGMNEGAVREREDLLHQLLASPRRPVTERGSSGTGAPRAGGPPTSRS